MSERITGRHAERAVLAKALDSADPELVAVYGRRRVGKTFLVRETYGRQVVFELVGVHDAPLREQLRNFSLALGHAMGSGIELAPPDSWQQAFHQLRQWLETRSPRERSVVFLDEVPWLASRRSRFLSALEHFWNSWASQRAGLVVVVCGSAASWMIRNVIHQRGGLYNRVTRRVHLQPFTLAETRSYLKTRQVNLSDRQVVELYMVLGGIPHYLKQVEKGLSPAQVIDELCFSRQGALRDEFDLLYKALFEHPERHVDVIRALAKKKIGLTRDELLATAGLASGGGASLVLEQLIQSGFVSRSTPYGRKRKDALYRLIDEYSLFYLTWIDGSHSSGPATWLKRSTSPRWRAWSGYAFEATCLKHVSELKRSLGIEAVETVEASWFHRPDGPSDEGAQIDLLIDRRDDCMNACEMKYSEADFTIDKRYAAALRRKISSFRGATGTRKTIFLTFITTHGLRDNTHCRELVQSSLTLDSLFG